MLRYRIENLGNSRALDYFRIDPDTGIIELANLLTNSPAPTYQVIQRLLFHMSVMLMISNVLELILLFFYILIIL